jgi:hypothetical protein
LSRLPKGPSYAVEVRNPELLIGAYGAALEGAGAVHVHNVWGAMPSVLAQARVIPPRARRPLVVRWLQRLGQSYADASARYAPFDRLVDEAPESRAQIAHLVTRGLAHGVAALVAVDNKAEGSAPESIVRLAQALTATPPAGEGTSSQSRPAC